MDQAGAMSRSGSMLAEPYLKLSAKSVNDDMSQPAIQVLA